MYFKYQNFNLHLAYTFNKTTYKRGINSQACGSSGNRTQNSLLNISKAPLHYGTNSNGVVWFFLNDKLYSPYRPLHTASGKFLCLLSHH